MPNNHRLDHSPFLVQPGKRTRLKDHDPGYSAGFRDKEAAHAALLEDVSELAAMQDVLWASKEYAVVIVLQALDAAGKDGTIRHVMSGVNPQGVTVKSFKAPTEEERLHHFLWRPMRELPAAGMMAIFNRSYYEEVLVVRVHPDFLDNQWLPGKQKSKDLNDVWQARYDAINTFEKVMSDNNTLFIKFFLNVSREQQRQRFLKRLEDPEKNWKFSAADVRERAFWDKYQEAYEDMLNATSTNAAPWYIIPADKKWFTRACVADIIASRVKELNLKYPSVSEKQRKALDEVGRQLEAEQN